MKGDNVQIALAGEYHVLAQLAQRGLIGSLTLSNTKGVDILVFDPQKERFFRVEVKTTHLSPVYERLFGAERFYIWQMKEKHETCGHPNLIFCFVHLRPPAERPDFFLVPSAVVAEYVRWQHQRWLDTRNTPVASTSMRKFRIEESDPRGYKENWTIFERA